MTAAAGPLPFQPAWWVPGPHLQSAWAQVGRPRRAITFEREVLTTPDGDELMLDHVAGPAGAPRVLLLHGLEGSSHSLHAQGLALLARQVGWRSTVLNFRSCARDLANIERRLRNRTPRLYHAGETGDLDLVIRLLLAREPAAPLYALGFSLGGSVLLKYLGEVGASSPIRAAATISVPYDLGRAARHLERRVGRLYARHFMTRLKTKSLDLLQRFPTETAHLDAARIRAARTFGEFDQAVTAPLHGFASADDYYSRCSAVRYLPRIAVPTLCVSSADDPFFPAPAVAEAAAVASPSVKFVVSPKGGHVGFVSGRWPFRPVYWAEQLVTNWLVDRQRAL